jgi:hypothetical protein
MSKPELGARDAAQREEPAAPGAKAPSEPQPAVPSAAVQPKPGEPSGTKEEASDRGVESTLVAVKTESKTPKKRSRPSKSSRPIGTNGKRKTGRQSHRCRLCKAHQVRTILSILVVSFDPPFYSLHSVQKRCFGGTPCDRCKKRGLHDECDSTVPDLNLPPPGPPPRPRGRPKGTGKPLTKKPGKPRGRPRKSQRPPKQHDKRKRSTPGKPAKKKSKLSEELLSPPPPPSSDVPRYKPLVQLERDFAAGTLLGFANDNGSGVATTPQLRRGSEGSHVIPAGFPAGSSLFDSPQGLLLGSDPVDVRPSDRIESPTALGLLDGSSSWTEEGQELEFFSPGVHAGQLLFSDMTV